LVAQALGGAGVNLWLALVGLGTTPYVLNHLGPAAYGVFSMITVSYAYLVNLEFGFGYTTVRFLARARAAGNEAEEEAVFGTALAVFAAAGVVGSILLEIGAPFLVRTFFRIPPELQAEAVLAFRIGGVILFASFFTTFFCGVLQALGRFGWLNGIRGTSGTLSAAATVAVVATGGGLSAVLWAQCVVAVACALGLAPVVGHVRGKPIHARATRTTFGDMAAFSGIVFLSGLAYQGMINGPLMVLGSRVSTGRVPPYAVPHSVLQRLGGLLNSASSAFFPFAASASAEEDRSQLAAIFQSHVRLTILVMGAFTSYLVVFAHTLLSAWIGPDFAHTAAPCLRLLALATFVLLLSSAPSDTARALGHPGWILLYSAAVAILGIGLAVPLASAHGPVGAAAAFLASVVAGTLPLLYAVAVRLLGLSASGFALALARPLLTVAAAMLLYAAVASRFAGLAAALLAGVVVTGGLIAAVFAWVLDPRERRALGGR
jgi:O-antigen/teichoic acid export membrane protein